MGYMPANQHSRKNHHYAKMSLRAFWSYQYRRFVGRKQKYHGPLEIEAYQDGKKVSVLDAIKACGGTPDKSLARWM